MEPRPLSDIQIKVRIVPKRVRWPAAHSSPVWNKAHSCVEAFENLVRNVDSGCLQAEQSKELTASAIRRRRAEISDHALEKLMNFPAFEIAEKELIKNIDALERLSNRDPQQVQLLEKFTHALHELREGIPATQRMVLDRCKMRDSTLVSQHY